LLNLSLGHSLPYGTGEFSSEFTNGCLCDREFREQTPPSYSIYVRRALILSTLPYCQVFSVFPRAVDIATSYGLDVRGVRVRVPVGARLLSHPGYPTRLPGSLGLLSSGVKRPVREADHSPLASAEANNTWICTSTLPYV
jgi:hypothetical protein